MFNSEQKHRLVKFKNYVFLIWYNWHTKFDRCDQDKLKGTNQAVLQSPRLSGVFAITQVINGISHDDVLHCILSWGDLHKLTIINGVVCRFCAADEVIPQHILLMNCVMLSLLKVPDAYWAVTKLARNTQARFSRTP